MVPRNAGSRYRDKSVQQVGASGWGQGRVDDKKDHGATWDLKDKQEVVKEGKRNMNEEKHEMRNSYCSGVKSADMSGE